MFTENPRYRWFGDNDRHFRRTMASAMMRMMVDHFISPKTSMGSPGMDEIRWLKPVRPGDRLRVRVTVLSAKRSTNKPDRGVIDQRVEVINQNGDVVMASKGIVDLRWAQVEFGTATLHVRRVKKGTPSTHISCSTSASVRYSRVRSLLPMCPAPMIPMVVIAPSPRHVASFQTGSFLNAK